MRSRLTSFVVAGLFLLSLAQPAIATQYAPPWADAMWAHFPGSNGLYTTGTMNLVKSNLDSGYHAFSTNPASANAALGASYAQSDAIWWMAGHAAPGLIQTYNSTNGVTTIYAGSGVPGASCVKPNDCLTNYDSSSIHDINLMVFQGCSSGSATSNNVRLPKKAHDSLLVDASIGFDDTIYFSANTSDLWAGEFTYDAWYGHMYVLDAAWAATNAVIARNGGSAMGYDSLITYGAGSTKIYPAQYGS